MDNVQQAKVRGGFRGRPVAVPVPQQQQTGMPRGGGRGYYIPPISPQDQSGGGYPTYGAGDFVKQLQYKISNLEHKLNCSEADSEKLRVELDKRTKALAKLEEEYELVANYAATMGGKDADSDHQFAQKCVKLEAKIAKSKAMSADKEKIKELEGRVSKLEIENKRLEETVQKRETDLEIQRSLNTRFHGMFKVLAETASENCREIDSLVAGLGEEGIIAVDDSPVQTTTPIPMEEIGGYSVNNNMDNTQMTFWMDSSSPRSSIITPTSRQYNNSGGSSVIGGGGGGGGGIYNEFDVEEDEPPPPAAFLDAINELTQEDLEELERMEREMEKEANANK